MRALVVALMLAPAVGLACWNEVRLQADAEVKAVAQAEALLQGGEPVKALQALRALYGKQAIFRPDRISTDAALGEKATGLVAIATVRAERFDPKTGRPAKKNRQRQVLRLAHGSLEDLARRGANDPLRQARYAEALARDPAQAAKAREALEALAKADLIAEPEAWMALARLRLAAQDGTGATAARDRCLPLANAARCALPEPRN